MSKPLKVFATASSLVALPVQEAHSATTVTGDMQGTVLLGQEINPGAAPGSIWTTSFDVFSLNNEPGVNTLDPIFGFQDFVFTDMGGTISGSYGEYTFSNVPVTISATSNSFGYLSPDSDEIPFSEANGIDVGIADTIRITSGEFTATIPATSDIFTFSAFDSIYYIDSDTFGSELTSGEVIQGLGGLNGTNAVNEVTFMSDDNVLKRDNLESGFENSNVNQIPEPSSIMLGVLGVFMLAARRRRTDVAHDSSVSTRTLSTEPAGPAVALS